MSLADTVARNLSAHRRRRNLTQAAFASIAGVSVSYVSMLERGLRSPPLETVETLAHALGVAPITLFDGSGRHR